VVLAPVAWSVLAWRGRSGGVLQSPHGKTIAHSLGDGLPVRPDVGGVDDGEEEAALLSF
jgi:hypothetical protein